MKMTKDNIKKIYDVWETEWLASSRTVAFPRTVSDGFRNIGTNLGEVESYLSTLIIKSKQAGSKLTKEEQQLIDLYVSFRIESKYELSAKVSDSPAGGVFLLKAEHGMQDKQVIEMDANVSFADIIAENSEN